MNNIEPADCQFGVYSDAIQVNSRQQSQDSGQAVSFCALLESRVLSMTRLVGVFSYR